MKNQFFTGKHLKSLREQYSLLPVKSPEKEDESKSLSIQGQIDKRYNEYIQRMGDAAISRATSGCSTMRFSVDTEKDDIVFVEVFKMIREYLLKNDFCVYPKINGRYRRYQDYTGETISELVGYSYIIEFSW